MQPEKVVLFGSYASDRADAESDIDIYIVSKEDILPGSYAENMRHYKKYSRPLKELKQLIPMDVLVHTLAMNKVFESNGSSFAREIMQTGERLI